MKEMPTLFKSKNSAGAARSRESVARGRYSRRATTEQRRFPDGVDRAGERKHRVMGSSFLYKKERSIKRTFISSVDT